MAIPVVSPPSVNRTQQQGMAPPVYNPGTGDTSTSSGQLQTQFGNARMMSQPNSTGKQGGARPANARLQPYSGPAGGTQGFTPTVDRSGIRRGVAPQPQMAPPVFNSGQPVGTDLATQQALVNAGVDPGLARLGTTETMARLGIVPDPSMNPVNQITMHMNNSLNRGGVGSTGNGPSGAPGGSGAGVGDSSS